MTTQKKKIHKNTEVTSVLECIEIVLVQATKNLHCKQYQALHENIQEMSLLSSHLSKLDK